MTPGARAPNAYSAEGIPMATVGVRYIVTDAGAGAGNPVELSGPALPEAKLGRPAAPSRREAAAGRHGTGETSAHLSPLAPSTRAAHAVRWALAMYLTAMLAGPRKSPLTRLTVPSEWTAVTMPTWSA